jgi:APA family basic amino acid/polyamine antiporter
MTDDKHLPRVLGPIEALCVVVGCVIGSGIFIVPAKVAEQVPAVGPIVLVWIIGGIFSAAGALTLAELGAMLPQAGGPYVYLRTAYGPLPAFLFGWTEFLVIRAGSMATLAAAFARYFTLNVPAPAGLSGPVWQAAAAVSAIAVVTSVNVLGTAWGGRLQVAGTVLKVGGVLALIVLPVVRGGHDLSRLQPVWPSGFDASWFPGMMVAMVGVLWAYDGWINLTPLAEEVRDPERNVPRAMIVGMAVLITVYIAATLAYHWVLPLDEMKAVAKVEGKAEAAIAAIYCKRLLGGPGVVAISLLVMCSTFISLNGNALTGPRAYFAMARDGLFPAALRRIHPRFHTPANAVMAQGIWAIVLTMTAATMILVPAPSSHARLPRVVLSAWSELNQKPLYDVLFTYVIFGANIFYLLAITAVFVLRTRHPDWPRPYRTWGYPITPLLYVVGAMILLWSMLRKTPAESLTGLAIIALGVPAYWAFRRASTRKEGEGGGRVVGFVGNDPPRN